MTAAMSVIGLIIEIHPIKFGGVIVPQNKAGGKRMTANQQSMIIGGNSHWASPKVKCGHPANHSCLRGHMGSARGLIGHNLCGFVGEGGHVKMTNQKWLIYM